jgi:predicted transcriptional regulator
MNSAIERLLTLRVCDVMSRNVVSIAATKNMSEAAGVLTQHFISGAPVIGQQGQCVGMLSAIDFVRCVAGTDGPTFGHDREPDGSWDRKHCCPAPATDTVASHMSALVQTVQTDQSLTDAARLMCQNHIHRLVALDDQGRPVGVITSLDIVAALINAVEE